MVYLYNLTYVGVSKNGAGPISKNPPATHTQPTEITYLGRTAGWSHSQPHPGADTAYTPPFMTNINPSTMDENWNWER